MATPPSASAELVEDYKAGAFKYLVNVGVFTTGFNVTDVDCIAADAPDLLAWVVSADARARHESGP